MDTRRDFVLADLQRRFATPRGMDRGRPREVRLTSGGRAVIVAAIVLILAAVTAGVLLRVLAERQWRAQAELAAGGRDTDAEVVRLWRTSGESKQPWVAYRFVADGRAYATQVKVPLSRWRTLEVGARMPIRYLAANPDRSAPRGVAARVLPLWVPYAAAAPLLAAAIGCLLLLRAQRELLSEGRAAPAIVTKHITQRSSHSGTHRYIKYEFPLLSGAVASGQSGTSSKPPAIGTVICVVYDPDRPRRNAAYPFSLVRLA